MNLAQGVARKLPDGLLHIQNFTVTKHSGMAGFLYAKVMTKAQQEIVELALIQQLTKNGYCNYPSHQNVSTWSEAHGCHRFPKGFLKARFKPTVFAVFKALNRCPIAMTSSLLSMEQSEALKETR
ncbi:hypothetical protein Kallioja_00021 [Pseudomonas phage vB_PpuP-Kallioja]